jgi:hypothetical protein
LRGRKYVGLGTFQVVRASRRGGVAISMTRCTLRDSRKTVLSSFETMYLEHRGRLSLIGHKRLVGRRVWFYARGKEGQWTTRAGDGAPRPLAKLGELDGVYEPANLPEIAMWLIGSEVSAGARWKIRLFHGPRAAVVTAEIDVNVPKKKPGLGIAIYAHYVLSSGERGVMGLDAEGALVTVMDDGVLLMPKR